MEEEAPCTTTRGATFLDYADTAEAAFLEAGGAWAAKSQLMRRVINIFLCMSQVSPCLRCLSPSFNSCFTSPLLHP